ncbi:MAG: T9SS type A sorting domain-containing protein, partial [Chitinophagaceae bacterium]|nr:T9SS type A sorting domain-containing protein [Chitinophagaceae bacterium]
TGGSAVPVYNLPFLSTGNYQLDKTAPEIRNVGIPDGPARIGDTIIAWINVNSDTAVYRLASGKIAGITVSQFTKQNDSSYSCRFIIPNAGTDIPADAAIPVSLVLNDAAGNSASYSTPVIQRNDLIDANKPVLTAIALPPDRLYKLGDTLSFTLYFNEKISVGNQAGAGGFSITVGTRTKFCSYSGGSGTDSIVARYIVQPGESDKDGIRVASPINWLNGELKDLAGNPALLSATVPSTKNILVDGVPPVISSVSTPPAAQYRTGNILDFLVGYSEKVWVEGTPLLPVLIGDELKNASYISGSGSTSLLFRYLIQPDDQDKNGIKLGTALSMGAASVKDEAGNNASPILSNIGALSNIFINLPSVTAVSVSVPSAGVYKNGDTLEFLVSFNENVFVQTAAGTPSLRLTVGSSSRQAYYAAGSGSAGLLFVYPVQEGDLDTNGIQVGSSFSFNSGTIRDEHGNAAPLSVGVIPSTTSIRIDAVNPSVRSVSTPARKVYSEGDTLLFGVALTEPVYFLQGADTPYLKLILASGQKKLGYVEGDGTSLLLFRYTVQRGDLDKKGIRIDSVISYSGPAPSDRAGNPLLPSLKNIASLSGVKIDAVAPIFTEASSVIALCQNAAPVNFSPQCRVIDLENNDELSWKFGSIIHGSISKTGIAATSNSAELQPSAIFYQPAAGYSGVDSTIIEISDGVNTAQKKLYFNIQPAIGNNNISAIQLACYATETKPINGTPPVGGNGAYTAVWESSVTGDTSGFVKTAGAGSLYQYIPGKLDATTWFRRRLESGSCTSISPSARITVLKTGFWTGRYDSDWNNSNNWCSNILPGAGTDVILDGNAGYDAIIKDSARCNNLLFQNQAQLTVNGTMHIGGNISINDGSIQAAGATLVFNGAALQLIPSGFKAGSAKNLIIDNPAGVAITAPLTVSDLLVLRKGTLITNDRLHLLSTARVGPSASGSGISGKLLIDHWIPGGRNAFRLLGHPFKQDLSLDMIEDSLDITGEGGSVNGFTNTATNLPSAFRLDAFRTADTAGINAGWTAFANTHTNDWKEKTGIRLLVRGGKGQGLDSTPAGDGRSGTYLPKPVTLQLTGPVHSGDTEIKLQTTGRNSYHLIANPYPAPVDWSKVATGKGIGRYYWVWDPLLAKHGAYRSYPFSATNTMAAFSAIIVKATDSAGADLLFAENCKAERAPDTLPDINIDNGWFISMQLESDSAIYDHFLLLYVDTARTWFDAFDAEKFLNEEANLYSLSRDHRKLSIDARPVSNASVIQLGLQSANPQRFRIRFNGMNIPAENTLQLHDQYLNKWIRLEKDSSYAFETSADTASSGDLRFEISSWRKTVADTGVNYKLITRVSPQPASDHVLLQFSAPDYATTTIRLLNLSGKPILRLDQGWQKTGQVIIPMGNLVPGLYLLETRCGEYQSVQKILKE